MRPANPQGRFHGLSAMLVEDNEQLRRVLELSLAEIGFAVTSAPSGDVARDLLQTGYAEEGAGEFPVLRKPFTAEELVDATQSVRTPAATP